MDKMIFMKKWYDSIMADEYVETTEQEMAYILYAAMQYYFSGVKINLGDVFGKEFKGLNRSMPNIYSQIDSIKDYTESQGRKNQKYDNEAVERLASQGMSQKEICRALGYDESKSNSLSSNAGYKKGRNSFLKENDSSVKNCTVFESSVQNYIAVDSSTKNCEKLSQDCDSSTKNCTVFDSFNKTVENPFNF